MNPIDVINYWYSDRIKKHWFSSTPELDMEIKNKYEQIWKRAADGEFDQWKTTPEGSLALVIILDQFPLNMYRGKAESFQTESKAIEVTMNAINNDFFKKLSNDKLSFLFMPLMHSENIEDQDLSVKLFKEYNLSNNLRFAQHHRDIIKKFGRFPHRNSILMREFTKEESEYMSSKNAFKG
jgi:uncharacterized protein (DUF924 family)